MKKIGFLGLGVMGLHMALNVDRKTDVEVVGFDVSEKQLHKYQAAGGTAAASVDELYRTCDVILQMLPTHEIIRHSVEEAIRLGQPGTVIVDLSSAAPDIILDLLMRHHNVDIQWGNHDVVWMGAAAGSPICICTVLKTTLAYHNHGMLEDCYGINLRHLQRMAEQFYGEDDLSIWMPHTDAARGPYTEGMLHRCAVMHKAISILMFKLECQVIDRNPDFQMQGRDYLRRIDWDAHTVQVGEKSYPLRDTSFPTVDPADPAKLNPDEQLVLHKLVQSFRQSERLQQHIEFLYAKGSVYHIENGNLLYHGCIPMTPEGRFASVRHGGRWYSGRALMDYADAVVKSAWARGDESALDMMWYLWCGNNSPFSGRVFHTFERAVVDTLCERTMLALEDSGLDTLCLAGGVSASRRLRAQMTALAAKRGFRLCMPELWLCTDNAAMIGSAAYYRLKKGELAPLELNAVPSLELV